MNIIDKIRQQLESNIDEKTFQTSQNFFKEKIDYYGVKIPVVNKISKSLYNKIASYSKREIFNICEILWQSGKLEESFIACNWAYNQTLKFEFDDYTIFEKWLDKYINNWASCDTLCNHTVAAYIEMFPENIRWLISLTHSENRWMRRGSAVTLILPARKGEFLNEIFEIADILLLDNDDLVQKGYGWMLKAASESHQKEVFDYVMNKKSVMPRTAFRYAIEKMPPEMRKMAMEK
jgi:3-methyladenine DNA glycosylase AlkD